ncbi:MBOAT family protein [candidate division WWE3 bacterium]|nr:MBOAT family protein [candidate division WWE3 bacterium]
MVFSSAFFLFLFLPIVLTIYLLTPYRWKNLFLLIASLVFYYWGEKNYSLIMLGSIIINYLIARFIDSSKVNGNYRLAKIFLVIAVILNLGLLVFFKYLGFIVNSVGNFVTLSENLLTFSSSIHLVAGISFYTFHSLSYILDVYWGQKPLKKLTDMALYIAMFPQLIAGPIIRYHTIMDQLINRRIEFKRFVSGVEIFILGLAKKVIIANTVATIVDQIFTLNPINISASTAWLGIIGYTIQIYFDFSGYSDMAIGLGRMLGFEFPENFNFPYISKSITEFWRRWHMSLSAWFKDYLYIPLGGSKGGKLRTYINLFIIFTLCGFWHGASWSFLVWGLWHGGFLVIEKAGLLDFLNRFPDILRRLYAIVVVIVGWVFFRADNLKYALKYLWTMLGLNDGSYIQNLFIGSDFYLALILGVLFSAPILSFLKTKLEAAFGTQFKISGFSFFGTVVYNSSLVLLFFLSIILIASNTYNPFIYYRF